MKTTETPVKTLVHEHKNEIEKVKIQVSEAVPLLQNVIDEGKKIKLTIDNGNFYQACVSPKHFFKKEYHAIIDREQTKPEVAGFKMKTTVILDQFELPDTSLFEIAASMLMNNLKNGVMSPTIMKIEDGTACIDNTEFQNAIDHFCIFATDPKSVDLWNKLTGLSDQLTKFNSFLKKEHNINSGINQNNISHYLEVRGNEFAPNLQLFLSLTRK